MSITFTPAQESIIQSKIQDGKYGSTEEVLDFALHLLDEYDRASGNWVEEVRQRIDEAIESSKQASPVDGEAFVDQMLDRLRQSKQS